MSKKRSRKQLWQDADKKTFYLAAGSITTLVAACFAETSIWPGFGVLFGLCLAFLALIVTREAKSKLVALLAIVSSIWVIIYFSEESDKYLGYSIAKQVAVLVLTLAVILFFQRTLVNEKWINKHQTWVSIITAVSLVAVFSLKQAWLKNRLYHGIADAAAEFLTALVAALFGIFLLRPKVLVDDFSKS